MKKFIGSINIGVLFMIISSFSFAIDGAFAKVLSTNMDSIEVVFFRNGIGTLLVASTIFRVPIRQVGGKPWLLLFRAFIGFMAMLAFFYNIAHIPLADAMTFSRTAPIFTAILAFVFLSERIGVKGWIAIFIGFIGIVFIMKPNGLALDKTDIFGLFSGLGAALAYTSVRELKKFYDTRTIVLAFVSLGTIVPMILMVMGEFYHVEMFDFMMGKFVMPHGIEWVYIAFMGIFGAIGQVYMTKSFGAERAGIVGAAGYSIIFFALIIGVILGDPLPDFIGLLGILLVVISGIIVAKEKV